MTDILLPWPPPCLWSNARKDRRSISGVRKAYREDGAKAALAAGFRKLPWASAHLRITFHAPSEGRRDLDNMLAAIKSGLDGVSDAIGIDDSLWSLTIQRGEVMKPGAVRIELVPPVSGTKFMGSGVVE
jgi:crossover junction endodeoxyribonuclease RusA